MTVIQLMLALAQLAGTGHGNRRVILHADDGNLKIESADYLPACACNDELSDVDSPVHLGWMYD